jgi:tripartite-type tricarboxylate transporter receptor subunit TctC
MKPVPVSRRAFALSAAACALGVPAAAATAAAEAQPWPGAKSITWIVGFAPGGSVDVLARLAGRKLSEKTGQPVVIENRPGGSGLIALQAAAKAAPDGYTLVTVPGPILHAQKVPELGRELTAVAMLAQGPMVLVGSASAAPGSVQALLAEMRRQPKAWSYASSGNGTSQHLAGELLNAMAGTAMVHVPYKGGGQAVTDVIGGQVPLAILGVAPVLPHIRSGKLRAYAVTTRFRIDSLPDVPTLQESGLKGYDASQWFVVGVPAGVPAQTVAQLNAWLNEIMASADLADTLRATGSIAGSGSARVTQAFVTADTDKWKALAQSAHLALD